MLLYDVLQQGLPMNVVPHWIETKGRMRMVSLRPRHPTMHFSAFRISNSEKGMLNSERLEQNCERSQRSTRGQQSKAQPTIRK